jgi:hypothetical protein
LGTGVAKKLGQPVEFGALAPQADHSAKKFPTPLPKELRRVQIFTSFHIALAGTAFGSAKAASNFEMR